MATYYFRNTNGNWNAVNSWSITSGGPANGAIPTSGDTAILDNNSGGCTVNAASNCLNLTLSGYSNTITMNNPISIATSGTLTLGTTAVSVAGGAALTLVGSNTLISGTGGHWGGLISFTTTSGTKTLSSNFSTVSLSITNATTLNGSFNLAVSGGSLTLTAALTAGASVPTLVLIGNSTYTGAQGLGGNLTFSGTGNITVSGSVLKVGGTITTVAGVTVTTTSSTLTLSATMPIFDCQHMTWNNVSLTSASPITFSTLSSLNISGTTTLNCGTGISFSGAGAFNPTGTLTFASNNTLSFPNDLNLNILNVGVTTTLGNSVTIRTQSLSGTGSNNLLTTSTPTLIFTGTGVWNMTGYIAVNTIFNSTQTTLQNAVRMTIATGTVSLTYSAGTIITTGSVFTGAGGGILNLNVNGSSANGATTTSTTGINFDSFAYSTGTLSLSSPLCVVSSLSCGGNFSASTVYCGGNFVLTATLAGTSQIVMNGTGVWNGAFTMTNNISFNSLGTITISGTNIYNTGTITWTSGSVNTVGGTLQLSNSTTLNTSGMSWNNITIITAANSNMTLNSLLNINGTLSKTQATGVSFIGTAGFSANTLSITSTNAYILTLRTGSTYTVSSSLVLSGTAAAPTTIQSGNVSGATFFNLKPGATQQVAFVTATDINSSGGQTIYNYRGTISPRTVNWSSLVAPPTLSYSWVDS